MSFEELPKPASYLLNIPDPSQSISDSIKLALGVRQSQQETQAAQDAHAISQQTQQANAMAQQQQQVAQQQAVEFNQARQAVQQNPTAEGLQGLMLLPGAQPHIEALQKLYTNVDAKQKEGIKSVLTQAWTAYDKGHPDIAQKLLSDAAKAAANSKMPQEAQLYGAFAKQDPGLSATNVGAHISLLDPQFMKSYADQQQMPEDLLTKKATREKDESAAAYADRLNQQTLNTGAAAAASSNQARLLSAEELKEKIGMAEAVKREAVAKAVKAENEVNLLPPDIQTKIDDFSAKQTASTMKANYTQNLLDKVKTGLAGREKAGVLGKASDFYDEVTGAPSKTLRLRTDLTKFVNEEELGMIPQGGGRSEGMLDLARTSFLNPHANIEDQIPAIEATIASHRADALVSQVRKEWAQNNGRTGMSKAAKDAVIAGFPVKQGDDLGLFIEKTVLPKIAQSAGGTAPNAAASSPAGAPPQAFTADEIAKAHRAWSHEGISPERKAALGARYGFGRST